MVSGLVGNELVQSGSTNLSCFVGIFGESGELRKVRDLSCLVLVIVSRGAW
jgi:hypothetical protein